MALGRECKIICNFDQAVIGIFQQMLCFFNLHFTDIIADGNIKLLFKKPGKVAGGKACIFGEVIYGNPMVDMAVNIIHAKDYWFGKDGAFFDQYHFLGIIQRHLVVEL